MGPRGTLPRAQQAARVTIAIAMTKASAQRKYRTTPATLRRAKYEFRCMKTSSAEDVPIHMTRPDRMPSRQEMKTATPPMTMIHLRSRARGGPSNALPKNTCSPNGIDSNCIVFFGRSRSEVIRARILGIVEGARAGAREHES